MKNLKKIKLHEGDQVLNDLQLKKIVGGIYVPPGGGYSQPDQPGGNSDYCSQMQCVHNPEFSAMWECWGPCKCVGGYKCVRW